MRPLSLVTMLYGIWLTTAIAIPCRAADNPQPVVSTTFDFTATPFDRVVEVLPPHFGGIDPIKLYDALYEKFGRPKDEFQSSAEYAANKTAAKALPILGSIRIDSTLAFKAYSSSVSSEYDADHKLLHIQLDIDPGNLGVLLQTARDNVSTYTARNGFGVEATVVKEDEIRISLDVRNPKDFKLKKIDKPDATAAVRLDLKLEPSDAEVAKSDLSALVVCKLAEQKNGFTEYSEWRERPTITKPLDVTFKQYVIYVNALEFWIYNSKTGQVYMKIPAASKR